MLDRRWPILAGLVISLPHDTRLGRRTRRRSGRLFDSRLGYPFSDSQAVIDSRDPRHRAGSLGCGDSLFDAVDEPVQSHHAVADVDFDFVAVELRFAHGFGDLFGQFLIGGGL